jgi:hypothetical protein
MRYILSIAAVAGLAVTSFAAPIYPLADGFPTPSPEALKAINLDAQGSLSNGKGATNLQDDSITNLQLIALNELFEVAFFTELLYNVTNKVHGYDLGNGQGYITKALTAVVAVRPRLPFFYPPFSVLVLTHPQQEKLHTLNANNALKAQVPPRAPIEPCQYNFPVTNFKDAIALAATFTDVVMGTLQDVAFKFAANGDIANVRGVGSTLGQEGEQEGFYRLLQNKIPSALPFLTTSVRDFAFTAIQGFIIPGSCPNIDQIKLTTFAPLTLITVPKDESQTIEFSFDKTKAAGITDFSTLSLVYINQQNLPIVEAITVTGTSGNTVKASAYFPYSEFQMNGLTIAALAKGNTFANAGEVAKATVFGPGLIEIN